MIHHRDAYYCENYGICKREFSVLSTWVNSTVFIFAALLWSFCITWFSLPKGTSFILAFRIELQEGIHSLKFLFSSAFLSSFLAQLGENPSVNNYIGYNVNNVYIALY